MLLTCVAEFRLVPTARAEESEPRGEFLGTREGPGQLGPQKKRRGSGNYNDVQMCKSLIVCWHGKRGYKRVFDGMKRRSWVVVK